MRSYEDVLEYIEEENVKFIRLSFVDVFGRMKNIAIMPENLRRALEYGISFDAAEIDGFRDVAKGDLFLFPDTDTLGIVPWRPMDGSVARMFCDIRRADGTPFENDTRRMLRETVRDAAEDGVTFLVGTDFEFYLFQLDENGKPTRSPQDEAGYFDVSPLDRGENIRREICFELGDMGIQPYSSHHEAGPGQNEVDFDFSDPLSAAENALLFKWMVQSIASANGAWADFSPKPFKDQNGNGLHFNFVLAGREGKDPTEAFAAGILDHARELTLFLNPTEDSYFRLGTGKAPKYVSWGVEDRAQLLRMPAGRSREIVEMRSPDPAANPFLALSLLIRSGMDGVRRGLTLPPACDIDLYHADDSVTDAYAKLPETLEEAGRAARGSAFLRGIVSQSLLDAYRK